MQLLLLLSALLTGLTGLIGAERVVEARQLERSAVAVAAAVEAVSAVPSAGHYPTSLAAPLPSLASVRAAHFAFVEPAPRLRLRVDERQRE